MVRHRPSEQYKRRSEDQSFWFKSLYYMEKFAILWVPLVTIISGIGFIVITPKMQINELKASVNIVKDTLQKQITANRIEDKARSDSIMVVHKDIATELKILLRLGCVNSAITDRDKTLVGLDCAELAKHE